MRWARERVQAVMMPSEFTADISLEDAEQLVGEPGRTPTTWQPIKLMVDAFLSELSDEFDDLPSTRPEENIQARVRGVLLMALSNKFGQLVLTTGQQERSGQRLRHALRRHGRGFAVLKDVAKTLVWRLSAIAIPSAT